MNNFFYGQKVEENMLSKEDINEYNKKGFIILKNYIDPNLLGSLKKTLFSMFSHNIKNSIKTDRLDEVINKLENEDHKKVYNVQKAIGSSSEAITFINSLKMGELHSDLYGSNKNNVHLTLMQSPVQFPNDDRFDFKWHQESGSYTGYSNILTCWFPILGPVNKTNGSMTLIPESHKDGKRECFHIKKESGLNDWVIDVNEDENSKAQIVQINPCDVVLFDSNVIHKSVANIGNIIRITGIIRALDMISGKEIIPLSGDNSSYISDEHSR